MLRPFITDHQKILISIENLQAGSHCNDIQQNDTIDKGLDKLN